MSFLARLFPLSKLNLVSNIQQPILLSQSHKLFSTNSQTKQLSTTFDPKYELKDVHLTKADMAFKNWSDHIYQAMHELNLENKLKNCDVKQAYSLYAYGIQRHPLVVADGHTNNTFFTSFQIAHFRLLYGDKKVAENYGINICILDYPFRAM